MSVCYLRKKSIQNSSNIYFCPMQATAAKKTKIKKLSYTTLFIPKGNGISGNLPNVPKIS